MAPRTHAEIYDLISPFSGMTQPGLDPATATADVGGRFQLINLDLAYLFAARRLLDWGFANAGRVQTPVGTLVEPLGPAPTSDVDSASADAASLGNDTDPISASTSSASFGGSSAMLRWGVLIAAVLAAAGLIVLTYVGNGSLARRRIRRRYHR